MQIHIVLIREELGDLTFEGSVIVDLFISSSFLERGKLLAVFNNHALHFAYFDYHLALSKS